METLYNYLRVANLRKFTYGFLLSFVYFFAFSFLSYAENEKMSLTIAPPLFQLSLQPGESWSSSITVVNNNKYDLTIYAEPVLFKPSGETGRPVFIDSGDTKESPAIENVNDSTLADWINISDKSVKISREKTYKMPIKITVPKDAQPGGHYAAILIGNTPKKEKNNGGTLNVSSSIASLIFLTVAGNVNEDGRIREFATEKSIYENAEAKFSLRFENRGNVHIQPTGDITIYNMFNKKRGYIPVNQADGYGNVLPGSVRKFTYKWKSDSGVWDIGRYRAEATIGFGSNKKQFVQSTIHFWVLPIVPLLKILTFVVVFVLFVGWSIKAYIRRAIILESSSVGKTEKSNNIHSKKNDDVKLKFDTLLKPIVTGIVDLRNIHGNVYTEKESDDVYKRSNSLLLFLREYKSFFIFVLFFALCLIGIKVYFSDVLTFNNSYSASEERPDGKIIELPKK